MFGWIRKLFGGGAAQVASGDPQVEMVIDADGAVTAPTVQIAVGGTILRLTHSQAQNLWGELGAVNRKIKKLYPAPKSCTCGPNEGCTDCP
jgi:hypothetical protein